MSHHNTTNLAGSEFERREEKAKSQEVIILRLFQQNPTKDFTPHEVMDRLGLPCPITSVRRAITNLTVAGELIRTEKKRMGNYGMNTYCWRLNGIRLCVRAAIPSILALQINIISRLTYSRCYGAFLIQNQNDSNSKVSGSNLLR